MKFSNPRKLAEFNDWPSGAHRVLCKFQVESSVAKGERVARTTTDKNGRWCKPKVNTYADEMIIVDGDDGRTYILTRHNAYEMIRVESSDFKSPDPKVAPSSIWPKDADYFEILELFVQGRPSGPVVKEIVFSNS